jgi:hypothetical protein
MHNFMAQGYYEDDNVTEGDKFLKGFETLYLSDTTIEYNSNDFVTAYIEASRIYVVKNNYTKAKEYLKRGLALFPDNERLREYYDVIKK